MSTFQTLSSSLAHDAQFVKPLAPGRSKHARLVSKLQDEYRKLDSEVDALLEMAHDAPTAALRDFATGRAAELERKARRLQNRLHKMQSKPAMFSEVQ